MVNYLALLGWSLDDHTELFTLADLEREFSLERVSRNPAAFDTKKLDALNGHYIRQLAPSRLRRPGLAVRRGGRLPQGRPGPAGQGGPAAPGAGQPPHRGPRHGRVPVHRRGRAGRGRRGQGPDRRGPDLLAEAAKRLQEVEPWTAADIEGTLRGLQTERGLKPKTAFQPVRLAITGRLVSPPLFESMELLGKPRSWPGAGRRGARLSDPPAAAQDARARGLPAHDPWGVG